MEATVLAIEARNNSLELGKQMMDVYKHAKNAEHASKMISALKEMFLVGHTESERKRKAVDHAEFVKLMEEGISITSVGKESAVGRMVKIDRHTGKPIE